MKLAAISFILPNAIDQHPLHAIQMHICAYTSSVYNLEPYSGIQRRRECLWTLVDPDMYMRCVDIFSYYSLYFSYLIFPQKTLSSPISSTIIWQTFPIITASYMTSPLHQKQTSLIYIYLCEINTDPVTYPIGAHQRWTLTPTISHYMDRHISNAMLSHTHIHLTHCKKHTK